MREILHFPEFLINCYELVLTEYLTENKGGKGNERKNEKGL